MQTEFILTLQNIRGIGNAAIERVDTFVKGRDISLDELKSALDELKASHKKFNISLDELQYANEKALDILDWSAKDDITIINRRSPFFPDSLKAIKKPPILLHIKGDLEILEDLNAIAVIGTRNPSDYGTVLGRRITEIFVSKGFDIVSGLALGCDTIGHEKALDGNGRTLAVLAHGLDHIYPKQNAGLAEDILSSGGVLVSEYEIGVKPRNNFFVERDRLQSGLSKAVCVIETGVKGGTMHTVGFCIEQGKPLGCILPPEQHRIYDSVQGNLMLINEKKAYPLGSEKQIETFLMAIDKNSGDDLNSEKQMTIW